MRIAILGATSMLAADFVALNLRARTLHRFTLFARDPARAQAALTARGVDVLQDCRPLAAFPDGRWDAVINFVGVGDPARAAAMGAEILGITREWDDRVLAHVDADPECRYIFLSSGAAFGAAVAMPLAHETTAQFHLNSLPPWAYYGIAKFYAEAGHRARSDRSIIDIRIFNYLSGQADLTHRFLVTEAIAAIRNGRVLGVDANDMWRDYLGEADFAGLVTACLDAPAGYNGAVDAYSREPVSKAQLLDFLRERFGLAVEVSGGGIDATGAKSRYFSLNRAAAALGYQPQAGSLDTIEAVARYILAQR